MNFTADDLKRLWFPIALALVLLVSGAASIYLSKGLHDQSRGQRASAEDARKDSEARVHKSTDEEREIRENLAKYQRLVRSGVIGPERRLDWIDAIAEIKTRRKLFEITYNLDAQKPIDYPGLAPLAGEGEILVTRMKLDMQLLHEGDLLGFLGDFAKAANTLVSVRSCRIARNRQAEGKGNTPRLDSDCVVDLITVREGRIGEGKG